MGVVVIGLDLYFTVDAGTRKEMYDPAYTRDSHIRSGFWGVGDRRWSVLYIIIDATTPNICSCS